VHLAHLGFPILGDEKYGDFNLNKRLRPTGLKRMALHAWRMAFSHPLSGDAMECIAPLPEGLRSLHFCGRRPNQGREFTADNLQQILDAR
jgi:23S rRNA pseudouridine955/2504/2580 synthase